MEQKILQDKMMICPKAKDGKCDNPCSFVEPHQYIEGCEMFEGKLEGCPACIPYEPEQCPECGHPVSEHKQVWVCDHVNDCTCLVDNFKADLRPTTQMPLIKPPHLNSVVDANAVSNFLDGANCQRLADMAWYEGQQQAHDSAIASKAVKEAYKELRRKFEAIKDTDIRAIYYNNGIDACIRAMAEGKE